MLPGKLCTLLPLQYVKTPPGLWGVNSHLPADIAVRWVKTVDNDFHARFSATARRYRYIILATAIALRYWRKGSPIAICHWMQKMERAAQCLLGENDFTSFRAVQCQSRTPWRNVKHVKVTRHGAYIVVDIKANAFVHHMVRNIVGSLIEIGCGNQDVTWMAELLALKDRTRAAATAKADGLYLVSVDYPDHFALPKVPMGPLFWRMTRVNGSPVTKDTESQLSGMSMAN